MPKVPDNQGHTMTFYERVDFIVNFLFDNPLWMLKKRNRDLSQIICKQFNLSPNQASRYIKEAKKLFNSMQDDDLEDKRTTAIIDREKIINLAFKQNKLQVALNAMRERDIISGIYYEQIEFTDNPDIDLGKVPLSDEALRLLQEFNKQLKNGPQNN